MEEFTTIATDNGNIYKVSYGNKTLIGYTCDKYNQIESLLDEAIKKSEYYYNLCVKNGLIKPKLTQEEISESLVALADSVRILTDKVDALSTGKYELVTSDSKSKPKSQPNPKNSRSIQDS